MTWIIIGYFSLFDFGLSRSLTHAISLNRTYPSSKQLPQSLWSALFFMLGLGIFVSLMIAAFTSYFAEKFSTDNPLLKHETELALFLLAATLPLLLLSNGLRAILEGHSRFDLVNLPKAAIGSLSYLLPTAISFHYHDLPTVVLGMVICRLLLFIVYVLLCIPLLPTLQSWPSFQQKDFRSLLHFGGWLSISYFTGPLLLYLGRFILAGTSPPAELAYFSTAYETVTTMLLIPSTYVAVLFPHFTSTLNSNLIEARKSYVHWQLLTIATLAPLCCLVVFFAQDVLAHWISPAFAEKCYRPAQILAIGVLINGIGHIAQTLIQAYGRPDLTAKLHVLELFVHLPYAVWLVAEYAANGAAVAWLVRVTLSTVALTILATLCLRGKVSPP